MEKQKDKTASLQHLIDRLNPLQREAYETLLSPLIVMAPAGTGKTDVIALRTANAITQGIRPDRILLMTFTNRSARSMRSRIEEVLGEQAKGLQINTFHGLCGFILREESENLSLPKDFIILDEEDAKLILREILSEKRLARGLYYKEERFVVDFLRLAREYPFVHGSRPDLREYFIQLLTERGMTGSFSWFADAAGDVFYRYQRRLREYGMVDFTSLVTGVLSAFEKISIRRRWQQRYDWVQVDEIQDTNHIEYEILRNFYERHHRIALFGDLHQTIYEWRGSVPSEIIRSFKISNPGYRELRFEENYRSVKAILGAAEDFLRFEDKIHSKKETFFPINQEEKIRVRGFKTEEEEGRYIAEKIKELKGEGIDLSQIAVLSRTNKEAGRIGVLLEREGIPVYLVEKTKFFSREEIKNALAYLKLMINPKDVLSLKRIDAETASLFLREEESHFLSLEDMLRLSSYQGNDPYRELMERYEKNDIVVFDVETTGLDVHSDEVIQIAALRGGRDGILEPFERFIRIGRPVGDSYEIHHISDEHLKEHGVPAASAFEDFVDFIGDSLLIGHNVSYDISISAQNMLRLGMEPPFERLEVRDTLTLARRLFPGLRSYSLENLFQQIGLSHRPTHNAMDDVIATLQLLDPMIRKLETSDPERRDLFASYRERFLPIAENLHFLRMQSEVKRPQDILHEALIRSGFLAKYQTQKDALQKLRELYRIFRDYDDENLPTRQSLSFLLEVASLGNDTDRILFSKEQVPVITVHQSKGLEFEAVFIFGASDESFPSGMSKTDDSLREERRLFYVAITRPKKQLFLTYHVGEQNELLPSRFIHQIDRRYLDYR